MNLLERQSDLDGVFSKGVWESFELKLLSLGVVSGWKHVDFISKCSNIFIISCCNLVCDYMHFLGMMTARRKLN